MIKIRTDVLNVTDKPHDRIDSLIGAGTRVEGVLTFSGGLRVEGQVVGKVKTDNTGQGTLVVSKTGMINGEVSVPHVIVDGVVEGDIESSSTLELKEHASIKGNISYMSLGIDSGAVVQGQINQPVGTVHQMLNSVNVESSA